MTLDHIEEQIENIRTEIRETPHHKGTEHHIGRLRARLAKFEERLERGPKSRAGGGFAVKKSGDATVVLVGPPSVGKSTLLNSLTNARSKVASYPFTTLTVVPGMLEYRGASIQLLDIPGLIGGAARGRGRGRQVLSVVGAADLVLAIASAERPSDFALIEKELKKAGAFDGGKIVWVVSKIDLVGPKQLKKILRELGRNATAVGANTGAGLEELKSNIFTRLNLIRVFLRPKGEVVDRKRPLILKGGATVGEAVGKISSELAEQVAGARVWGKSALYPGQRVSLEHRLTDGDEVSLTKSSRLTKQQP